VPTFAEAGLSDYAPAAWLGLVAPAGTPKPIVDKLSVAMRQAAGQNPALIERWLSVGGELKATTPEEFRTFIKAEQDRMSAVIRRANIKLD
jgi:tripartite-type tricarboxylate transporter receptor subunit TctC